MDEEELGAAVARPGRAGCRSCVLSPRCSLTPPAPSSSGASAARTCVAGRRGERLQGAVGAGHRDADRERDEQLGAQLGLGGAARAELLDQAGEDAVADHGADLGARVGRSASGWRGRG